MKLVISHFHLSSSPLSSPACPSPRLGQKSACAQVQQPGDLKTVSFSTSLVYTLYKLTYQTPPFCDIWIGSGDGLRSSYISPTTIKGVERTVCLYRWFSRGMYKCQSIFLANYCEDSKSPLSLILPSPISPSLEGA